MKKLLSAISCCFACILLFAFVGCSNKSKMECYGLEEAFESGLITHDDLESIAYYLNEFVDYPEPLDKGIATAIKRAYAKELRKEGKDFASATAKDVMFLARGYFGEYNGCYAVRLTPIDVAYRVVEKGITVDGVTFRFTGPEVTIWKAVK